MYMEHPRTGYISDFMYKVYGWMAGALTITSGTAFVLYKNPAYLQPIMKSPILLFGIIIAQFALVILLSTMLNKMTFATAALMFIAYSFLTGITFSSIFFVYTEASIYMTFGICAAMFATMSLYGYFTKEDLTAIGSIATMALFGLIIAMIINIFAKSSTFDYLISFVGVAVFTLLTAYDVQKIKHIGMALMGQGQEAAKVSLIGALMLYLDFINLFLFLLRLFGQRRND